MKVLVAISFCLAVSICSNHALSQITSAATTTGPAHVYIQTPKGVNLYSADSTGKLSLVSGSPFKTVGLMVGTNGKYFISLGTTFIHAYAMASSGAIGKEVSTINTALYAGAECGTTGRTVLDHTGQFIYVLLNNATESGSSICYSYQSYRINSNTGQLTFLGQVGGYDWRLADSYGQLTVTANDTYAYTRHSDGYSTFYLAGFKRETGGALDAWNFTEVDPTPPPGGWTYMTYGVVADPTNHLAVLMFAEHGLPLGDTIPDQLGSYTVDANGNLTSTNNYQNMPTPNVNVDVMNMSPSGVLLAVAGTRSVTSSNGFTASPGLQIFHFNGAKPITRYSAVLTTTPIDSVRWDNANHLYALSYSTGKLFVYTVTPTSIKPAPGAPFTITQPTALFVR